MPMTHQEAIETHAAERYQLDEMTELERHAFESHYFECPTCAEGVRVGAALASSIRAHGDFLASSPAEAPEAPAVFTRHQPSGQFEQPRPRRLTSMVALAVAASLALVAGYQSLVVIPELRTAAGPQALSPVTLRPLSRGDLPVVTAGNGPVALSLDVNTRPTTSELLYDLETAAGVSVLAGSAPVPAPGTPLLLLLPGNTLSTGRYVLTLREASGQSTELGTYRFVVQ